MKCQICESGKRKWKYTFHKAKLVLTFEICDKCAETILEDDFRRYRQLERIEEVKTLKLNNKKTTK